MLENAFFIKFIIYSTCPTILRQYLCYHCLWGLNAYFVQSRSPEKVIIGYQTFVIVSAL